MSTQPPTTWRSMPCWSIQARRPARSDSGFDTGRVGLRPANAKARLPASSMTFSEGNRSLFLLTSTRRSGATRLACDSMLSRVVPSRLGFTHRRCRERGALPLPGGERGGVRAEVILDRLLPPHPRLRRDLAPWGEVEQAARSHVTHYLCSVVPRRSDRSAMPS